jgi:hypothetical protein
MTIEQIHTALEQGHKVNWENSMYELAYVPCEADNRYGTPTYRNGRAIRVSCIANGFGSLLAAEGAAKCFIKEEVA